MRSSTRPDVDIRIGHHDIMRMRRGHYELKPKVSSSLISQHFKNEKEMDIPNLIITHNKAEFQGMRLLAESEKMTWAKRM